MFGFFLYSFRNVYADGREDFRVLKDKFLRYAVLFRDNEKTDFNQM